MNQVLIAEKISEEKIPKKSGLTSIWDLLILLLSERRKPFFNLLGVIFTSETVDGRITPGTKRDYISMDPWKVFLPTKTKG